MDPGQPDKLFMDVLIGHKFYAQIGGESIDVILCNSSFRVPRVLLASYNLLVLLDIWSHQG
jgi:hypothetical protein